MNLFTKSCACGGMIFGPRLVGKARGQWLGYDQCTDCRASGMEAATAGETAQQGSTEGDSPAPKGDAQ